jgi:hypothetical protein
MTITESAEPRNLDPARFFVTDIFTGPDYPEDIAIITLPHTAYSSDGEELVRLIANHLRSGIGYQFQIVDAGPIEFETVGRLISDVALDESFAAHEANLIYAPTEHLEGLVNHILYDVELPIQNSPITGTHLANLFSIGGTSAYLAATTHIGFREIAIYFLMVGGTRIVLGASSGISEALQHGLKQVLLSWMNVSEHDIQKKPSSVRAQSRSR